MHLTLRIRPLRVLLAVAAVVVTAFLFRGQLLRLFMRPEALATTKVRIRGA